MDNRPIGFFDSGVGGLTCISEMLQVLPDERIIYFGDTARTPYGSKAADTIRTFSLEIADFLVKEGVKMIRMVDCPVYFEKPEDIGDYDKAWEEVFDTDKGHLNAFGYGRFMDFFRDYLEKEGLL